MDDFTMRIPALLSIFSVCFVFQATLFAQTTIIDIFKSLNLDAQFFSAEQAFGQIHDFLATPGLEKPISLEFLTINAFVPGITRLIDLSNFRPELMILIYDFINVFPKDAQGRNVLFDLVVEKVRRFLGYHDQEFDQAIQDCIIHRSLPGLSKIFENLFALNRSEFNPTFFEKLENLLKFLSELICKHYKHFCAKTDYDKTQPVLFCCDIFKALEIRGSFSQSELFSIIKALFKAKALALGIDALKGYLETGEFHGHSSGICKSCGKEIFFGWSIKIIAEELHHQSCWFDKMRKESFVPVEWPVIPV